MIEDPVLGNNGRSGYDDNNQFIFQFPGTGTGTGVGDLQVQVVPSSNPFPVDLVCHALTRKNIGKLFD